MDDHISIDIPSDIAAKLQEAANLHGSTIASVALHILRQGLARSFTADERLAKSRYYLSQSSGPYEPLTKEQVREGAE